MMFAFNPGLSNGVCGLCLHVTVTLVVVWLVLFNELSTSTIAPEVQLGNYLPLRVSTSPAIPGRLSSVFSLRASFNAAQPVSPILPKVRSTATSVVFTLGDSASATPPASPILLNTQRYNIDRVIHLDCLCQCCIGCITDAVFTQTNI